LKLKIIAVEKDSDRTSINDFHPFLQDEALAVWKLYQKNILREIYFHSDKNNAVLILECDSIGEANNILSDLPLVKNKLIEFELIPLKPYTGFARLFKDK